MARLLDERLPVERLLLERLVVERDPLAREAVERDPVEREALARDPDERALVERLVLRDPLRADPPLLAFAVRDVREEAPAWVSAARSLSKSLSACLLVLAALRRSAPSAEVTSL